MGTGTGMRQFNQKVERLKAASAAAFWTHKYFGPSAGSRV